MLDRYAKFSGLELGAAPEWRLERAVESALLLWFSDRRLRQSTPGVISICALVVAATVSAWKYQEKTTLHQNRHEQMPLPTYAQSSDGTPGKITLWRVKDGARLRDYDCPGNPVSHLAFSADGERLVSYDYALRVWPIEEVDS